MRRIFRQWSPDPGNPRHNHLGVETTGKVLVEMVHSLKPTTMKNKGFTPLKFGL